MAVKGSREFRARLKAIRQTFKPVGKAWAETTRDELRARTPRRTGATAASYRVRNATQRRATVYGSFIANFLDAGTKAHDIEPKRVKALRFDAGGRTIFSKKVHHPRTGARPFKRAAAEAGLRKNPMAEELIREWNNAR